MHRLLSSYSVPESAAAGCRLGARCVSSISAAHQLLHIVPPPAATEQLPPPIPDAASRATRAAKRAPVRARACNAPCLWWIPPLGPAPHARLRIATNGEQMQSTKFLGAVALHLKAC